MVKKSAKKRVAPKKTIKNPVQKPQKIIVQQVKPQENKLDKVLIENFVSLQRVLTNLAVNLDHLSNKISKLLDLFEISAKALAEKDFDVEEKNERLAEKLDNLLDQNKVLAKGMSFMHERMPRDQFPPPGVSMPPMQSSPMPMQQAPKFSSTYTKELPPMPPMPPTSLPFSQKQNMLPPPIIQENTSTQTPEEHTFESPLD